MHSASYRPLFAPQAQDWVLLCLNASKILSHDEEGILAPAFVPLAKRLRDGVIRDIERQNRKKENIRLLGEQIILTEQLEAEREKTLLAKDLKKH